MAPGFGSPCVTGQMRTRTATRGLACVLLAVIIWLASCSSRAETKQDYVARANAICASATRAIRNVAPAGAGAVSLSALGHYLSMVTPIVDTEVKQLRALPLPALDRRQLEQYLTAVAAEATDYRGLETAARSGNRAWVSAATAALQASPATTLAGRYGLTSCVGAAGTVAPS